MGLGQAQGTIDTNSTSGGWPDGLGQKQQNENGALPPSSPELSLFITLSLFPVHGACVWGRAYVLRTYVITCVCAYVRMY